MIFPFLNGILGFDKAPVTWALLFINLLFLMISMDQPENLEQNMKNISNDEYYMNTQSQLYLNYINEHGLLFDDLHKNVAKQAAQGKEEQFLVLGQLGFRDRRFVKWALDSDFVLGDKVAYKYWKTKTKKLLYEQSDHLSYKLGVSVNDFKLARWFSYQFIHSGFIHFIGNMIFRLIFGCALEPIIGGLGLLVTYLASGMIGAGAFLFFSGPTTAPLVGASGAVSGIMALFAFLFAHKKVKYIWFVGLSENLSGIVLLPAWISFVMWFVSDLAGFISSSSTLGGIAYSAHLGGELTGIIVATVLFFTRYGKLDDLFINAA